MGVQEVSPHGSSWTPTRSGAVPAAISSAGAGTRPGRQFILALGADIATAVHQSWLRRDLAWVAVPIALAVLLGPH